MRAQAIAFAGICQAALLVHRTAIGQVVDPRSVQTLIRSIRETTPATVDSVYDGVANLQPGVGVAVDLVGRPPAELLPVLKYVMSILDVEVRLRRRTDLIDALRSGIDALERDAEVDDVVRQLSQLYQNTISRLDRRIHVVGSPALLKQDDIAATIRTLLLAGIRSAWLWHQSGGRRWHLLLRRNNMRTALRSLVQPTMMH
jgi:high frequency lysogenization protein